MLKVRNRLLEGPLMHNVYGIPGSNDSIKR